jgi:hypothetical protein
MAFCTRYIANNHPSKRDSPSLFLFRKCPPDSHAGKRLNNEPFKVRMKPFFPVQDWAECDSFAAGIPHGGLGRGLFLFRNANTTWVFLSLF